MTDYKKLSAHKNLSRDYQRAKTLRQTSPITEQIMWNTLRLATKEKDFRFRRQHPITPYIVDFVCLKARLVVEVDGMSHDQRLEYDAERDDYLKSFGYTIMRFSNQEVLENRYGVVETVINRVHELIK